MMDYSHDSTATETYGNHTSLITPQQHQQLQQQQQHLQQQHQRAQHQRMQLGPSQRDQHTALSASIRNFEASIDRDAKIAEDLFNQLLTSIPNSTPVVENTSPDENFQFDHHSPLSQDQRGLHPIAQLKSQDEITIENILEDDPLLSFTTTLDRQESNDTILQSSSPIKGSQDDHIDYDRFEIEQNFMNLSQQVQQKQGHQHKQQEQHAHSQSVITPLPTPVQYHQPPPQISHPPPPPPPPPLHSMQTQFVHNNVQYVPATIDNKPQQQNQPNPYRPIKTKHQRRQSASTGPERLKLQIQNQTYFSPQYLQQQQTTTNIPEKKPAERITPPSVKKPSFTVKNGYRPIQNKATNNNNNQANRNLPPTPPPQTGQFNQLINNKSSSTTKLSKVKKSNVFTNGGSSTIKLKKSQSFLNTSANSSPLESCFSTLDFSKQLNKNNSNLMKDHTKFQKPQMKVNLVKSYEFVIEPGHDKNRSTSAKSTPKRNFSTPTILSATNTPTSAKFPKFPKPPPIEKSTFTMFSPTNPNSSPTNSDASGQSPLTSTTISSYPFKSPIPSNINKYEEFTSSPTTTDAMFFKPNLMKRGSATTIDFSHHVPPQKQRATSTCQFRDMSPKFTEYKMKK